jgi:hypothetical protein
MLKTLILNNLINQLIEYKNQYKYTLSFKDRTSIMDTINSLEKSISIEDKIEYVKQLEKDY